MAVVSTASLAVGLVSCSSLQLPDAGRRTDADWLTEGGTWQRSNSTESAVPLPLEEEWDYNAGGAFGPGGPLVAGNYVIVSTRKGEIHAVSIEKGKKAGADSFGESLEGTPSISGSVIFIPAAWGSKHGVVAFDLSAGSKRWQFTCPPVNEGVLLAENLVMFSDQQSTLHAVNATSGKPVWSLRLDPRSAVTTTPVLTKDHMVVVADDHGRVYAVELQSGRMVWRSDLEAPVYSTPAVTGGTIVLSTARGSVLALDAANGTENWRHSADNPMVRFASPAVRENRVVVGASDGSVRALAAGDGSPEWIWHGDGAITAAPVIAGSAVFFGTMGRAVYALDVQSGEELWTSTLRGRVKSTPTVHNGSVYFLSEPRNLHKFSHADEAYADGK